MSYALDSSSSPYGNRVAEWKRANNKQGACDMTQIIAVLSTIPRLSYHLRLRLPHLRVSDVLPGIGYYLYVHHDTSLTYELLESARLPATSMFLSRKPRVSISTATIYTVYIYRVHAYIYIYIHAYIPPRPSRHGTCAAMRAQWRKTLIRRLNLGA